MFDFLKKAQKSPPVPRKAPATRTLTVGGRAIPLTVREHATATRITLRIEPGGKALKMTVPRGLSRREADDFLSRHQGWLAQKLSRIPEQSGLRAGAMLLFRGVEHEIRLSGRLRGLTTVADEEGQPILLVHGLAEHAPRKIADFLKKEARRDLTARVAVHAATIGRRPASITLKDTSSRWGSCSTRGNLNFSWRIAMAPPFVLDYLAAHEVAHLKEMNHSPRFWSLCGLLCPEMQAARTWLKQHGNRLHAVEF